jgi:hypothetical protein
LQTQRPAVLLIKQLLFSDLLSNTLHRKRGHRWIGM